jgi:hypothetical protein
VRVIAGVPINRFVKLEKIKLSVLAALEQKPVPVATLNEGLKDFRVLDDRRRNEFWLSPERCTHRAALVTQTLRTTAVGPAAVVCKESLWSGMQSIQEVYNQIHNLVRRPGQTGLGITYEGQISVSCTVHYVAGTANSRGH